MISQDVLERLFDIYATSQAELAILTTPCGEASGQDASPGPTAIRSRFWSGLTFDSAWLARPCCNCRPESIRDSALDSVE